MQEVLLKGSEVEETTVGDPRDPVAALPKEFGASE